MVEYLKQWARQRGWHRLIMESRPDITPTMVLGEHILRRGTLERRGFTVIDEQPAPPDEVENRLHVIKDLAAGKTDYPGWADWYVENFPRLSAGSGWKLEYDKNYVMACEL